MTKIDRLLLCDCAGTMKTETETAGAAVQADRVRRCSKLCTDDIDIAAKALGAPGTTLIACEQEAPRFADLLEDLESPGHLITADIRDRAGWNNTAPAHAKQAALLAEAALPRPETPVMDVQSRGTVLVLGDGTGEAALDAARRLAPLMAVTCLLEDKPDILSPEPELDLAIGRVRMASGALGCFDLQVEEYAPALPSGRGTPAFADTLAKVTSTCDVIVDLRKAAGPLFPSPLKRDGYLRADPADRAALAAVVFEASQMQGVFEKPIYIRYDAQLCAHSRASQAGCSNCVNVCSTGAITTSGDHVVIDPAVCAGCGACAAACPSGAAAYVDPSPEFLFSRLSTLASAYRAAGGDLPRALFHDGEYGTDLIALSARHGRGLPTDVIPVAVNNVEGVGHAEVLAALGVGFASVSILATPHTDTQALSAQLDISRAIVQGTGHAPERVTLIEPGEPDALESALYTPTAPQTAVLDQPILPLGGRREVTRLAASALAGGQTPTIPLPADAPYGVVKVDQDACTLCLACASLCPSGALFDNPDKPQLSVQETSCLQCGICASTCPEKAISLVPQLNLAPSAMAPSVLNEEEPFECISCSQPFGVRSTIERIAAKLEGNHPMFTGSNNADLIRMCDDCRVKAQYHSEGSPLAGGPRPAVRRTEDYQGKKH